MFINIKKRILAIAMVCAMLISSLPTTALATEVDYAHLVGNIASVKKPSVGGALQILNKSGVMTLCDSEGNPIQLRGMSTFGLQWTPGIINNNAFAALANDFDSNVIRLAMYVTETGYGTDAASMVANTKYIEDGIRFAQDNDMYVIVDWHVTTPGDPNAAEYSGAKDFFAKISAEFPNATNIIYELTNEPSSSSTSTSSGVTNDAAGWAMVKSYAEPIIKSLRDSGNKNLVIVGNPCWSQRPDLAADNPVVDSASNTIYTVHFYTGTHLPSADNSVRDDKNVMDNVRYALAHGVAVFASEWGTSESSGNNGPFLDNANAWLDFLNKNNISWCNWSLTNKNETSAAFTPFVMNKTAATDFDPGADQVWAIQELSI